MLIPLSIGDLRVACAGARTAAAESANSDSKAFADKTYNQLLEGAVHNGLKPTEHDLRTAREMADRDVEHAMENHPSLHIVKHIDIMLAMANYVDQSESYEEVIIDALEFQLLKDHLPAVKKD